MTTDDSEAEWSDLTGFQRDLIVSLSMLENSGNYVHGLPHGQAVGRRVAELRDEKINHGRLYPNLDTVVEEGLVEKSKIDRRTNGYRLTEDGEALLESHRETIRRATDELAGIAEGL